MVRTRMNLIVSDDDPNGVGRILLRGRGPADSSDGGIPAGMGRSPDSQETGFQALEATPGQNAAVRRFWGDVFPADLV